MVRSSARKGDCYRNWRRKNAVSSPARRGGRDGRRRRTSPSPRLPPPRSRLPTRIARAQFQSGGTTELGENKFFSLRCFNFASITMKGNAAGGGGGGDDDSEDDGASHLVWAGVAWHGTSADKITREKFAKYVPFPSGGCRTGYGDKLSRTQAEPGQAINSAVAYFPSVSCATSCARERYTVSEVK